MIFISTNQDNSDYLEIDRDCMVSLLLSKDVPENIKEIASEMYCKMYEFEKKRDWGHISKISIRKSSYLGNYLLYANDIEVINKDYIITYDKVVNAFNIVVYDGNPIYKQLLPLFKTGINVNYNELLKKYDSTVLDYILDNSDFDLYLLRNGDYDSISYVVYEDEQYSTCNFTLEKKAKKFQQKVLKTVLNDSYN